MRAFTIVVIGILIFMAGVRRADAQTRPFIDQRFGVKTKLDLIYGSSVVRKPAPGRKNLLLDLYEPDTRTPARFRPAFIAIHGGGLTGGDKRTENMEQLCRELAARGFLCVSINYRLRGDDPEAPGETVSARALRGAIDDAATALEWLNANAARFRLDRRRIAVGGSSAGAVIAMQLAYGSWERTAPVAAVMSWVGGLDGEEGIIDSGEPPLFIVHGLDDRSVPVTEALALANRAGKVAVGNEIYVCEGLGHNVPLDRRPAGRSLYERLSSFLYEQMDMSRLGRTVRRPRAAISTRPKIDPVPCPK